MKSVDQPIIIADSISPEGIRLTTFQLRYWRPIHSELMTHRVFSRNAGSSRARPSKAIIEQVRTDPWGPLHWGANEPGMQANEELNSPVLIWRDDNLREPVSVSRETAWKYAAIDAASAAHSLMKAGYHKQIVNRLLEPFTYIDVVVTATDFANWYALRDHKDAQPEIRRLAELMKQAHLESIPKLLQPGEWHLPYITKEDWVEAVYRTINIIDTLNLLKKASAARCARVSYKLFDGSKANFADDLELFDRLLVSEPLHASPAEHQATPDGQYNNMGGGFEQWKNPQLHGNFRGWNQHRKMLPNEYVPG